jgi:hypothetical protein
MLRHLSAIVARSVVIDLPRRPDAVRAELRRTLADIDRASELFAEVLPLAGADGPELAFVGTVDVSAFHLRVVWPSSWFNRHGPMEILGTVTPTTDGSRVTAAVRRPRWFVVITTGMSLGALSLMLSAALESGPRVELVVVALVIGVAGLSEALRFAADSQAAEAALRRVVQPEGRGRLVWD